MCGSYTLITGPKFYSRFSVTNKLPSLQSFDKSRPGQFLPIIYRDQKNIIDVMRWGLIPQWAKNLDFGAKLFNARSETVAEKPSFRGSFNSCRCLVPASGFFENRRLFRLQKDPIFSMAGLYSIWESPDGSYLPTFTIITTQANDLIAKVHHRMPVILDKNNEDLWLDPTTPHQKLFPLFNPYPPAFFSPPTSGQTSR